MLTPEGTGSPIGVWNVVWDRSATNWSPPYFHGTLILGGDGTVGLDWAESTGDPVVRSVKVDGTQLHVDLGMPGSDADAVLEGTVEGDALVGQITWTSTHGTVPWSPLRGRRVPTLASAP